MRLIDYKHQEHAWEYHNESRYTELAIAPEK